MFPDHFLDTNVVIGSKFFWDRHNKQATQYFERLKHEKITQHISMRMVTECEHVIDDIRSVCVGFLDGLSTKNFATICEKDIVEEIYNYHDEYIETHQLFPDEEERLYQFLKTFALLSKKR